MHIRVYYKYCPQTIHNLAEYERTNAGASSSPAAAEGRCVANAIQVYWFDLIDFDSFIQQPRLASFHVL